MCLFYTNPLNRDEMKARGDGWRKMMEGGKSQQGSGCQNGPLAARHSPK